MAAPDFIREAVLCYLDDLTPRTTKEIADANGLFIASRGFTDTIAELLEEHEIMHFSMPGDERAMVVRTPSWAREKKT